MTKKLPKPKDEISAAVPLKLASMLTPTSEAKEVSFKDLMAPASGKGFKVDLSKFTTLKSKDENVFYVIGSDASTLRMSFRLWKEASNQGTTSLGFRIRIGDKLAGEPATDAELSALGVHHLTWTGGSPGAGHRSMLGCLSMSVAAWEAKAVAKEIVTSGFVDQLYLSLSSAFSGFELMPKDALSELLQSLALVALQDVLAPSSAHNVRFHLGSAVEPLFDVRNGESYARRGTPTAVTSKVDTKETKPTGPVPYAAPHPKDALKAAKTAKV